MDLKKFRRATRYNFEKRRKYRRFSRQNKKCKKGQIVLIGDSITELFDVHLLDGCSSLEIYNRGISGDTSDRLLERLDKNLLNIEPSQVVLLIGTNDLSRDADEEYIFSNIKAIANRISQCLPAVKLTVQCVYPINRSKLSTEAERNDRIDRLNELIKNLESDKIRILDITNMLKDRDGELLDEFSDDGLHPNETGFKLIAREIGKVIG